MQNSPLNYAPSFLVSHPLISRPTMIRMKHDTLLLPANHHQAYGMYTLLDAGLDGLTRLCCWYQLFGIAAHDLPTCKRLPDGDICSANVRRA
jgi:hypothetical protein